MEARMPTSHTLSQEFENLPSKTPMRSQKGNTALLKLGSRISRILSENIGENYASVRKNIEHIFRNHDKGAVTVALNQLTTGREAQFSVQKGILMAT